MVTDVSDRTQIRLGMLRSCVGSDICVAACDPLTPQPAPLPAEAAGLSKRSVDKRRREFAAGRAVARQAMVDLGFPAQPVIIGEKRAPVWPDGLTGSITHTQSCAMAGVARASEFGGIGLDVEEDTPLKPELWDAICSADEQSWMRAQADPGQMGKLIFSAKEAAYKCQYSISQRYYGFDGMELEIDMPSARFLARFTDDQLPFQSGDEIAGRFAIGAGVIVTAATLPRMVADQITMRGR